MQTFAFYIIPHTAMVEYVEIKHLGKAGISKLHASLSYKWAAYVAIVYAL